MLFGKFWGITGNMVFLNYYNSILKRKHICKKPNNNNFYHADEFFHVVIEAMVMTLYMYIIGYFIIDKLQTYTYQ